MLITNLIVTADLSRASRLGSAVPLKLPGLTMGAAQRCDAGHRSDLAMERVRRRRVAKLGLLRQLAPARGLDRRGPPGFNPAIKGAGGAASKHSSSACAILRATQAFQALRLIFLQLGQDVRRTPIIILNRGVIYHKSLKRHGILSSLAQRWTTIRPCRRSNADAARSGPAAPLSPRDDRACRRPRAPSILPAAKGDADSRRRPHLKRPGALECASRTPHVSPAPAAFFGCGLRDAKKSRF